MFKREGKVEGKIMVKSIADINTKRKPGILATYSPDSPPSPLL